MVRQRGNSRTAAGKPKQQIQVQQETGAPRREVADHCADAERAGQVSPGRGGGFQEEATDNLKDPGKGQTEAVNSSRKSRELCEKHEEAQESVVVTSRSTACA